jgi:8-oxo-dGTP diphosphatase
MLPSDAYATLVREAEANGIQQLVVGAVIEEHDYVLILRRPATDFMGGIWELPSGKAEPRETLDQALRREVLEETGLIITGIRSYLGSFDYQSGSGKPSRQYNFAVRVERPEPVKLTEHDAYRWADATDDDLPVTEAVKAVLGTWRQGRAE